MTYKQNKKDKKGVSVAKVLREKKNLSQQQVANRLGISRTSYIAFEKGSREITLKESRELADIFGISVNVFLNNILPDTEKYQQMLFEFLRHDLSKKKDGKVPKTKLAKLLYLADFGWFYENLESMSGMQYRKIAYGPVPDEYFRIVDELYEEGKLGIEPTDEGAMLISPTRNGKQEPTDRLSTKEKKFIAKIVKNWWDKKTQEIVSFTHNQRPYKFCKEGEMIPYELIIQENPGYVY